MQKVLFLKVYVPINMGSATFLGQICTQKWAKSDFFWEVLICENN